MRILITGAGGFIGSSLTRYFAVKGVSVVALSRPHLLSQSLSGATMRSDEITEFEWEDLMNQFSPNWIIHCAGKASVPASFRDVSGDFESNTLEVFSLLDRVRRFSPTSRFLLLSSAAVYGAGVDLPIKESTPLAPVSPYGFHKRKAELVCEEFSQLFGIDSAVVRVFSAYGERLRKQVCWDLSRKLLDGNGELILQGTGEETRDFIHVDDLCVAVDQILKHSEAGLQVYNVASGYEVRIRDIATQLSKSLGVESKLSFDGVLPPGVPVRWVADVSRLKTIGFLPSISMEDGLSRYAYWVKNEFR